MLFRIRYTTRYAYEQPAFDSRNELRVCPSDSRGQKRLEFRLQVTPAASIAERRDDFGNLTHSVSVAESHNELTIVADSIVDRIELNPERGPHTTFREYLRTIWGEPNSSVSFSARAATCRSVPGCENSSGRCDPQW